MSIAVRTRISWNFCAPQIQDKCLDARRRFVGQDFADDQSRY
jgi:hypothetical protein